MPKYLFEKFQDNIEQEAKIKQQNAIQINKVPRETFIWDITKEHHKRTDIENQEQWVNEQRAKIEKQREFINSRLKSQPKYDPRPVQPKVHQPSQVVSNWQPKIEQDVHLSHFDPMVDTRLAAPPVPSIQQPKPIEIIQSPPKVEITVQVKPQQMPIHVPVMPVAIPTVSKPSDSEPLHSVITLSPAHVVRQSPKLQTSIVSPPKLIRHAEQNLQQGTIQTLKSQAKLFDQNAVQEPIISKNVQQVVVKRKRVAAVQASPPTSKPSKQSQTELIDYDLQMRMIQSTYSTDLVAERLKQSGTQKSPERKPYDFEDDYEELANYEIVESKQASVNQSKEEHIEPVQKNQVVEDEEDLINVDINVDDIKIPIQSPQTVKLDDSEVSLEKVGSLQLKEDKTGVTSIVLQESDCSAQKEALINLTKSQAAVEKQNIIEKTNEQPAPISQQADNNQFKRIYDQLSQLQARKTQTQVEQSSPKVQNTKSNIKSPILNTAVPLSPNIKIGFHPRILADLKYQGELLQKSVQVDKKPTVGLINASNLSEKLMILKLAPKKDSPKVQSTAKQMLESEINKIQQQEMDILHFVDIQQHKSLQIRENAQNSNIRCASGIRLQAANAAADREKIMEMKKSYSETDPQLAELEYSKNDVSKLTFELMWQGLQ